MSCSAVSGDERLGTCIPSEPDVVHRLLCHQAGMGERISTASYKSPQLARGHGKSSCHSPLFCKFTFHTAGDAPWAAGQSPQPVCGCRWGPSGYSYIYKSRQESFKFGLKIQLFAENLSFCWIILNQEDEEPEKTPSFSRIVSDCVLKDPIPVSFIILIRLIL